MGVNYYVACRDCKVVRDLDKLRPCYPSNAREANQSANDMIGKLYNVSLLVGFMTEHQGHNCTMFNDHADQDSIGNFAFENKEFWR